MSFTEVTPRNDRLWQIVRGSVVIGPIRPIGPIPKLSSSLPPTLPLVEMLPKQLSTIQFAGFPFPSDKLPPPKFHRATLPCCVIQPDVCETLERRVRIRESSVAQAPEQHDVKIPCELQRQSAPPLPERYTLARSRSVLLPYRFGVRFPLVPFCRVLPALL